VRNTDVSHESIRVNWNQKNSIRHKSHLQSTRFPFRYDERHVRGYDSSMDREVKASSGRPAVICRLLKSGSVFPVVYVDIGYGNNLRSAWFILATISCIFSNHPVRHCFRRSSPANPKHTQSARDNARRFSPVCVWVQYEHLVKG
jgi:hypothetical protein